MSLEINPDPDASSLLREDSCWGDSLPRAQEGQPSSSSDCHSSPPDPSASSNISPITTSTFDEDVFQAWNLEQPSDDFIRDLLSIKTEEDTDFGPLVDPMDLEPTHSNEDGSLKEPSISLLELPSETSLIPTILLEGDEEVPSPLSVSSSRPRGRPRVPKAPVEKRSRGRPLGSATKNRVIPVPKSENEAKYLRTRELNNEASRRCRLNRKQRLQSLLMEEVQLRGKNAVLKEKVRVKEELIDRLKSKLIALASADAVPMIIPV